VSGMCMLLFVRAMFVPHGWDLFLWNCIDGVDAAGMAQPSADSGIDSRMASDRFPCTGTVCSVSSALFRVTAADTRLHADTATDTNMSIPIPYFHHFLFFLLPTTTYTGKDRCTNTDSDTTRL
jgi:hypothetical protein